MLREIYCEEFHQKYITFHDGLNVVLGSPKADNSIGKSTLMLIVDFAFGGNTYVEASDILQNVGEHSVGFKFCFDGKDYHFLRSIPKGIQFGNVMKDIQKLSQCQLETIASGLLKNTALTCIS